MSFFYKDQALHVGSEQQSLNVFDLVKTSEDPIYLYNLDHILRRAQILKSSFSPAQVAIHYAMKANSNRQILTALREAGYGVDTVSGGEIQRALDCGFSPNQIIFSGVAKTKKELILALQQKIKQINVESLPELEHISQLSRTHSTKTDIVIRVNPDVNPQTHPYITTGFRENKFGISFGEIPKILDIIKQNSWLQLRGLSIHIGSQLLELTSIEEALEKSITLYRQIQSKGFDLCRLDIGGGIGIDYHTADESRETQLLVDYGKMARQLLEGVVDEIQCEPGRTLVARAGTLVGKVQYIKHTEHKKFIILNTGMHHLLRPALYEAHHRVLPTVLSNSAAETYDIVGPICESADFLAKDVSLSGVKPGDSLAIMDSGAYGFTMASHYNLHSFPQEWIYSQGQIQRPL